MSAFLTLIVHYSTACIFYRVPEKGSRNGMSCRKQQTAVKDATFSVMVTTRCACSQVGLRLRSWLNWTTGAAHTTRSRICRCTNVKGGVGRSRTARQLPSGKRTVCHWVLCRVRLPSCGTAQRRGFSGFAWTRLQEVIDVCLVTGLQAI